MVPLGYTVTKLALHAAGLVRKAPKRSAHRKKRPRRPLPGMLLHQDGSRHAWIEDLPAMDLIVTMDDATSGESIHTENSYKYTLESFGALARGSTWTAVSTWADAGRNFSVHALVRAVDLFANRGLAPGIRG
jgi:hypothetical protein